MSVVRRICLRRQLISDATKQVYCATPRRSLHTTQTRLAEASAPSKITSTASPTLPSATRLKDGVKDFSADQEEVGVITGTGDGSRDWSRSFHGLSAEPFPKEVADILLAPLKAEDVEIKPDGIIYLPEIKYRRILNKAFGPGGWGLAPRGETIVTEKPNGGGLVTREYALVCHGRLIAVSRGEQDYFDDSGIPTAMEGCKSNAIMRCCKDLGIASELWDPRYIRKFKKENCEEKFGEHIMTKKKKKLWTRKGDPLEYPYQISKFGS